MGNDGNHSSDLIHALQEGLRYWTRWVYDDLSHQHAQGGDKVEVLRLNLSYEETTEDILIMVTLLHRSHPCYVTQRRYHRETMGPNSKLSLPEKVEQKDMQLHQDIHWECCYLQEWWFVLNNKSNNHIIWPYSLKMRHSPIDFQSILLSFAISWTCWRDLYS